jgi:hypothetical protein
MNRENRLSQKMKATTIALFLSLAAVCGLSMYLAFQNGKLQNTVADLEAKLTQAQASLNATQKQIKTPAPEAAKTRAIPIEISTRKAVTGSGLVLVFKDNIEQPLTLNISCKNLALGNSKTFRIEVQPKTNGEIGSMQGWAAASGDIVEMACDGYDDSQFKIP